MGTHNFNIRQKVVWFCFFFSGLSALVYEVVWVRQFEVIFGAGTYALGAVLTAFMAGLSLGGWLGGRKADQVRHPLRLYGILEILIGVYALLFPFLYRLVQGIYLSLEAGQDLPAFGSLMIRFFAALLLLILPTAFMGATLPLLAKTVTRDIAMVGRKVGGLYGVNIVGAVLGVLLSGFFLMPTLGQSRTILLAAGLNLILGLAAVWISRDSQIRDKEEPPAPVEEGPSSNSQGWLALLLITLSGFSAMVYQTCYTRLLVMTLGGSVYAFSTMLAVFLGGLSLGALAASRGSSASGYKLKVRLALVLAAAGLTALLTGLLIDRLPYLFLWFYSEVTRFDFFGQKIHRMVQFLVSATVMTPTALFLGAAFPLAVKMGTVPLERMGDWVGKVYSWNTLGAILGSFLAAFALLPYTGIQTALGVGVFLHLTAASFLGFFILKSLRNRLLLSAGWLGLGLLLVFLPEWNHHRLAMGPYDNLRYIRVERLPALEHGSQVRKMIVDKRVESMELLYYKEGVASTVTVERLLEPSSLLLFNNGKPEASTQTDLATQQLICHLPLLWFESSRGRAAREVALIGLASGISAGAALQHSLDRLTVAEIETSMPDATAFFKDYNFNVLREPRFHFVPDDGRHYLQIHPGQQDVVISEPSNPWISGVSNLFTRESFETAKRSLSEDGVFCQWVQVYNMSLADLKTITRTFHSVFPHTTIFGVPPWPAGNQAVPDLILVGSLEPLTPRLSELNRLLREPKLKAALDRIGIKEGGDLVSLIRMGPPEVSRFEGEGSLNTDDNALIEYSAPHHFYRNTYPQNLLAIQSFQTDPTQWVKTESSAELKKLLLRISKNFSAYWRQDLAEEWRKKAERMR